MKVFAKKTIVALCIFAFLASGRMVYAVDVFSFHQNPSVPSTTSFTITPSSITQGSDQSSTGLWDYDQTTHRFSAVIPITNIGNSEYTPTIAFSSVPSGWTGSTSPITAIAKDGTETVTLYMTSTDSNPDVGPIGDFTVTIS